MRRQRHCWPCCRCWAAARLMGEWGYRARALGGHHVDLLNQVPNRSSTGCPTRRHQSPTLRELPAPGPRLCAAFAEPGPGAAGQHQLPAAMSQLAGATPWSGMSWPHPAQGLDAAHAGAFPVLGCVGYRGYWDRGPRRTALAAQLRGEGWDVHLYGVPAYSTLGYSNWVGGDPLLSTFLRWRPPPITARLVFHELAHQRAYAPDDSGFNESLRHGGRASRACRPGGQGHPDPAAQAAGCWCANSAVNAGDRSRLAGARRPPGRSMPAMWPSDKPGAQAASASPPCGPQFEARWPRQDPGYSGYLALGARREQCRTWPSYRHLPPGRCRPSRRLFDRCWPRSWPRLSRKRWQRLAAPAAIAERDALLP